MSDLSVALPVEFGSAGTIDTEGTGWLVGFSDWCKSGPHGLRYMPDVHVSRDLCVKWFSHAMGDPNGQAKPVSTGRSMSVLISQESEFRLEYSAEPSFPSEGPVTHSLRRAGDFVIWGPGVYHRAFGLRAATILTIRWKPNHSSAT